MQTIQRFGGAENPKQNGLLNGPLRAWSKAFAEYSMTWGHTLVAVDMMVSSKAADFSAIQGGTAGITTVNRSLTR